MRNRIEIDPRTPAALKRDLKKCQWNMRALARLRGVNVYWVIRLVKHGEEPKNKATRLKLSLPARRRRPSTAGVPSAQDVRPPAPEHVRWWRKLSKEARDKVIVDVYDGFCKYQKENNHG